MSVPTPMQRFHQSVVIDRDGCWIWNHPETCPQFFVAGRQVSPRRWFWQQANGNAPRGKQLRARCRKRRCVNPECCEIRDWQTPQLKGAS